MHAFEQILLLCVILVNFLCISQKEVLCDNEQIGNVYVDVHSNLTLPCTINEDKDVMWIHEGRDDDRQLLHANILENGSLYLLDVEKNSSGVYVCMPSNSVGEDNTHRVRLFVRTPPSPLVDVKVQASTILAMIFWAINDSSGYPIDYFTAQYRLAEEDEEWQDITPIHIMPNSRQIDVYKLVPNTTYAFRIWAANQLGDSEITVLYATTKISNTTAELERHFLKDISNFDTRIWILAVLVVMGTLVILGTGMCILLYQECKTPGAGEDQDLIELIPNIIPNPGYEGNVMLQHQDPDENSNNEITTRLNNNTVVVQRRLS